MEMQWGKQAEEMEVGARPSLSHPPELNSLAWVASREAAKRPLRLQANDAGRGRGSKVSKISKVIKLSLPRTSRQQTHLAMIQNQWYHFGIGEFTTHFGTYCSGWIGMFTGVRFEF